MLFEHPREMDVSAFHRTLQLMSEVVFNPVAVWLIPKGVHPQSARYRRTYRDVRGPVDSI